MKRLLIVVAALLGVAGAALGILVWNTVHATSGPRIEAARHRKALIIVDLQEDYTGPQAKQRYQEPERVIAAANQLIESARAGGWASCSSPASTPGSV